MAYRNTRESINNTIRHILPPGGIWGICVLFILTFLLASCAKMGQPDGGWYDETPPRIIGCTPADKGVNVKSKKIAIYFDEFIQVDNPTEKVVVSPPQIETPEIKGAGKKIIVELKDSLKENTTYTVDFSDAISDNNEGNPLGNYTYSFSTSDHIDTLEVSGNVVNAENLEPIKGILVGLYAIDDDFTITDNQWKLQKKDASGNIIDPFLSKPLLRVSRTDSRGKFIIRGIAPGKYRVVALQDADGNYFFNQKSEMIAFNNDIIEPHFTDATRQDTIWKDSLHIDSIRTIGYTRFIPDDIVLKAFTEKQTDRYFLKTERTDARKITFFFSGGDKELPKIKGLNFNSDDAFIVESSINKDTITYWLRDTALVNQDTLSVQLSYMATDTIGNLVSNTDTIDVLAKVSYEKRMKDKAREYDEWKKKQEKAKKRGREYLTEMPVEALEPQYNIKSQPDPDQNISIVMPTPIARIDTSMIHLYAKHDTLWYKSKFIFRERKHAPRTYELLGEWRPGIEYSLEIDSTAFTDIYGAVSPSYKQGFKVRTEDDYGTLLMTVDGMQDTTIVVQILDSSDKLVKEVSTSNGTAEFFYVNPGTYYMRMFVDRNKNGIWDTGDYAAGMQAEDTYYYPESIECKAKWDITLSWNPMKHDAAHQKPYAITKQKPEQDKKIKYRNAERAKKKGIQYIPQQY